jgi:hypothetical protein
MWTVTGLGLRATKNHNPWVCVGSTPSGFLYVFLTVGAVVGLVVGPIVGGMVWHKHAAHPYARHVIAYNNYHSLADA